MSIISIGGVLSLGAPSVGGAAGFYRTITIDHTKVGATDQTNFPVLVSGTYSYLATVANGGKVQNANGYDVGFFSDSGLATRLKHETVIYTAATGVVEYHVKVPTVSHTTDTVIYMNYGDTSITTDQSDKTNVWDAGALQVHHMGDGSSLSLNDSTSHAFNGTASGTPTAIAGQVGGAVDLDTSSYYYTGCSATNTITERDISVAFWVKKTADGSENGLFSWAASGAPQSGTPFVLIQDNSGTLKFYVDFGYRETSQTLSTGTWYHVCVTLFNEVTALWKFYLNGALLSGYTGGIQGQGAADTAFLGTGFNAKGNAKFDEWRIANVTRSADWVLAEYNNQSSPATFYAVGSETAV